MRNVDAPSHLIIGGSFSTCSKCGGNASPHDNVHTLGGPLSGWNAGSSLDDANGCGAEWEYAALECATTKEALERTRKRFPQIEIRAAWIVN